MYFIYQEHIDTSDTDGQSEKVNDCMNSRNICNGSTIKQVSFGCYLNYDVFTYFWY